MLVLRKCLHVTPLKIRDLQKHKQQSCQNRHNFRHQFVLPTLLQSWSKVWPLTKLFCFSAQSETDSRVTHNFPVVYKVSYILYHTPQFSQILPAIYCIIHIVSHIFLIWYIVSYSQVNSPTFYHTSSLEWGKQKYHSSSFKKAP